MRTVVEDGLLKALVTGSAGFIGSALVMRLPERGHVVIGIDNHNSCYAAEAGAYGAPCPIRHTKASTIH